MWKQQFCSIRAPKTKREHPLVPTRSNGPSVQPPEAGGSACSPRPGPGAPWGGDGASLPPDGIEGWGRFSSGSPLSFGPLLLPVAAAGTSSQPRYGAARGNWGAGAEAGPCGRASSSCSSQRLQAEQPRIPASCRGLTPLFLILLREIFGVGSGGALEKSGEGRGELRGGSCSKGEPLGVSQDMAWCWAQSWQLAA